MPTALRYAYLTIMLLLSALAFSQHVMARDQVGLITTDSTNKDLNLAPFTSYYIDNKNALEIGEIVDLEEWMPLRQDVANFGYSPATHWLRVKLNNIESSDIVRLLEIGYALLDTVQLYVVSDGHVQQLHEMGDSLPFKDRVTDHRHFLVPIHFKPEANVTLFLRVKTESSVQVPLHLWDETAFVEGDQYYAMGQGFFFGVLAIMIIYNLFLFRSFRDKNYLFFSYLIVSIALLQGLITGYGYQMVWPSWPKVNHFALPISVALLAITYAMFSMKFLELKKITPKIYVFMVVLVALLCILVIATPFLGYQLAVQVAIVVSVTTALTGISSGIYAWSKGYEHAKYFTSAFFALVLGTTIIALNKLGILPRNSLTENAAEIGAIMLIILLAFALNFRINNLRQDKETAEQEVRSNLEKKVAERTIELSEALDKLERVNSQLARQTREDGLTGALNRRAFDERIQKEWKRAHRNHQNISLIMCDIDNFKYFNDEYGHIAGDDTLRLVSECLKSNVKRPYDDVFRYGGEEFSVVLPDTNSDGAMTVAERIRRTVSQQPVIINGDKVRVTISCGVATIIPEGHMDYSALVSSADEALYSAKDNGRNRVEIHGRKTDSSST